MPKRTPSLSAMDDQAMRVPDEAAVPRVTCVVLNSNRRDDTVQCLQSIKASDYGNSGIVLLDCLSTDGSVDAVKECCPDVRIVELKENLGYAGNNNVGIRAALDAGAEWVFVLNEDTVIAPDCLSRLVDAGRDDPRVGIVGPLVYHHDEPTVIQSAGGGLSPRWEGFHYGQNEADTGQFGRVRPVQWISGCAILVRRDVIEDVGLIDERFFIYWEETEWCLRAHRAGWKILHVPDAKAWHKGVKRDYRPPPSVTYYSTRNRLLMLATHHAPLPAWLTAWAQLTRTIASWTLRPRWKDKRLHRNAMWHGISDFLRRRWGRMPARS